MATRILIPLALVVAACTGKTTPTTETTPTETETTPTADTSQEEVDLDFPAKYIYVSAQFGWDAANFELVDPALYGTPLLSSISWLIYTEKFASLGYDFSQTAEYCYIDLLFPAGAAAPGTMALADATAYTGFDHSGDAQDFASNCTPEDGHNIGDLFGTDQATYILDALDTPWGVGIGELDTEGVTIADVDLGGRVYNMFEYFGAGIEDDWFYANAVEIDPSTYDVVVENNDYVDIPSEDVWDGANLATGLYFINMPYILIFNDTW
jgi:hypothetical protein